jgi:branched-chain amino acid transport system substrate-binding protein
MMSRKAWIATAIALSVALIVVLWIFFGRNRQNGNTSPKISIGAILPLTGPAASLGKWIQNGYNLAVEEINQDKIIPEVSINLVYEDGMSDPRSSVSALTKLTTDEGIHVITTTLSPVALSILPIVKEKQLILFAAAAHPAITGSYDRAFRHNLTLQAEVNILATYMVDNIKPLRSRLVHINDDYGIGFKDYWQSQLDHFGIQNSPSISFDRAIQDVRSIAVQALNDSPDCIILVGYGPTLGTLLRRIRENGFTGTILVNNAMPFPDVRAAAGDAASGVFYVDYDIDYQDSNYISVNDKYNSRYGENIPPIALFEHNTLILIAKVYKETGGDFNRFASYLRSQEHLSLPGEIVTITKEGDIIPKLRISKIP